jgi:hypothetical protein
MKYSKALGEPGPLGINQVFLLVSKSYCQGPLQRIEAEFGHLSTN